MLKRFYLLFFTLTLLSNATSFDIIFNLSKALSTLYKESSNKINYPDFKVDNNNSKKVIYLTFDDGPTRGTQKLIKFLEQEGVKATMFCVGKHIQKRRAIFEREKRIKNLLIANHTYSHADEHYKRFYSRFYDVLRDIEHSQSIIGGRKFLRLAGRNVWRLPEIKRDDYGLPKAQRAGEVKDYDKLAKDGYYIFGWDVDWSYDYKNGKMLHTAKELKAKIKYFQKKGWYRKEGKIVLLAHDFMFKNDKDINQLKEFIKIMREDGWSFETLEDYCSLKPKPLIFPKYYQYNKSGLAKELISDLIYKFFTK